MARKEDAIASGCWDMAMDRPAERLLGRTQNTPSIITTSLATAPSILKIIDFKNAGIPLIKGDKCIDKDGKEWLEGEFCDFDNSCDFNDCVVVHLTPRSGG